MRWSQPLLPLFSQPEPSSPSTDGSSPPLDDEPPDDGPTSSDPTTTEPSSDTGEPSITETETSVGTSETPMVVTLDQAQMDMLLVGVLTLCFLAAAILFAQFRRP